MNRYAVTKCVTCRSPLAPEINARLRRGESPERVSEWLKSLGISLTGKSLRLHQRRHLETPQSERSGVVTVSTGDLKSDDLATLVRDIALSKVAAGDLDPNLGEGLRAQQMIDAREAKSSDRDLMLQLAGLLSGAVKPIGQGAYVRPPEIEAEYAEIDAELDRLLDGDEPPIAIPDRPR